MATRRRASRQSVTGALTDLQRRVRYLQNKPAPTSLGNHSVVRSAIQPRAVSTDQIAANAISNDQIQADAVREAQILDDSITRDKIQNGEVVAGKLGQNSVVRGNITDGEVVAGKLGQDSVFRGNITDGEIVDGKLAGASVNLINMKPNSVDNGKLVTDSVNFRTVATNAIGNENMLDNSVGNGELQNDSVGSGELRGDSVGFSELQSSSVGNSTIQNGAVTRSKIGSGQVGPTQIENGAITTTKIASRAVTGDKIADGTISSPKLGASTPGAIVALGARAGTGINKSGATFSVSTSFLDGRYARGNHRHNYSDRFGSFGERTVTGLTGFPVVTSSIKRKKDVQDYELKNPKNLLNLNFKKFKYKRSDSYYHTQANREWMHGYIIEELMDLGFDEVIHYDKDGNPAKLDYSLFSALVLELVKVQQQEIDCLQEKVKKLEEK